MDRNENGRAQNSHCNWLVVYLPLNKVTTYFIRCSLGGQVTQSFADSLLLNLRLVGRVWLWAPMIYWGERRWRSAKSKSYLNPLQPPGSLSRMYKKFCMRSCPMCPLQWSLGRITYGLHCLNRHWLDFLILRFLSLAVQLLEFELKPMIIEI